MTHLSAVSKKTANHINTFPLCLAAISHLHKLEFTSPVTFFVGENGSGKSTLLEAIAADVNAIAVVFDPMMQMARFPVQVYPQRMQWFLLSILPVAFLTTFPTQALLGRLHIGVPFAALLLSALLLFISHRFFNFALRFYGSASS